MQLKECLSEACGECRSGLCDAALCSCQLSCEAAQEVVLSLLRCQNRYGRQYSESIRAQEDHVISCRACRDRIDLLDDVLDVLDRIRYTSILCNALVSEIDLAFSVYSNVLKKSISSDSVVDVGLGFLVEVDDLSIAAAFEVEYAFVVPAVLVIADQQSLGICGKGCLTCAGQTEEDSCVLAFHICVRGAVHSSDALQRKVIVHHGEDTLLHLAAVPCVDDNLLTACDVESSSCLGVHAHLFVVLNLRLGSVVNDEIGLIGLELFRGRLDEHVLDEVCLPGNLNDETNCHAGVLVGAAESIHYIELLIGELFFGNVLEDCPVLLGERVVVIGILGSCPPNGVLGVLIHDDIFVFRRTAGENTGHNVNCVKLGQLAFLIALEAGIHLSFEQLFITGIMNDLSCSGDTVLC